MTKFTATWKEKVPFRMDPSIRAGDISLSERYRLIILLLIVEHRTIIGRKTYESKTKKLHAVTLSSVIWKGKLSMPYAWRFSSRAVGSSNGKDVTIPVNPIGLKPNLALIRITHNGCRKRWKRR